MFHRELKARGRFGGTPGQNGGAREGIELVSNVNDIPKGSRLAVSTNLLACLISVCMRATGQAESLTGALHENERRARAGARDLGNGWEDRVAVGRIPAGFGQESN